jgi:hypothetical protein
MYKNSDWLVTNWTCTWTPQPPSHCIHNGQLFAYENYSDS